jgi:hypothetical protein
MNTRTVITRTRRAGAVALVTALALSPPASGQSPQQIDLAARTAARNEAARSLVPLLKDVRQRTRGGVSVQPGTVPDSPFAGTQTTLFAYTVGKRSVRLDPKVVEAMDRLIAWKIGDAAAAADAELFDEWLDQLSIKAMAVGPPTGALVCDPACVVARMTKLDDTWGGSPRDRAGRRDELLLDALIAAVEK